MLTNSEHWDWIMNQARKEAAANLERRKVVAVLLSPRARKLTGHTWAYVIQCGRDCNVCSNRERKARQHG